MESRFKMRLSRMFRGSFGSCRTRNLPDVIEGAVFVPQTNKKSSQNDDDSTMDPLPPRQPLPFPSICRPRCPETANQVMNIHSIIPRRKISDPFPPFFVSTNFGAGQPCLPASPDHISPPYPIFYNELGLKKAKKKKKKKKTATKKKSYSCSSAKHRRTRSNNTRDLFSSSSQDSTYFGNSYYWSSSSEEEEEERGEDDEEALFTSRSLSSDSSGSHLRRHRMKCTSSRRRKDGGGGGSTKSTINTTTSNSRKIGVLPVLDDGKVKGSFAVVKSSSDPYNDFRTSMLEMIVEKQIFSVKDLEQLLQCFLSLNSYHHRKIILEVFSEIWETLFCNWSY